MPGLATTDMAVAAMLPLSLLMLDRWLRGPSFRRALWLGGAVGLGALAKFSFVVFFPVCAVPLIALHIAESKKAPQNWFREMTVAAVVALMVIWAGYQFTVGTLDSAAPIAMATVRDLPRILQPMAAWVVKQVTVPAPDFFDGLAIVRMHDAQGDDAYLFGELRHGGWWYYFPVLLFFKTPIPFLVLALWGAAILGMQMRHGGKLTAFAFVLVPIALMLSVLPSSINIGVRHILPIYPLLSILAAVGGAALWRARRTLPRAVVVALLGWLFVGVAVDHPDYLAWFNEAAGKHPERIAVDSNLDWGQDILRLNKVARERQIDRMSVLCVSTTNYRFADEPLPPHTPTRGWVAVSETALVLDGNARKGGYRWLDSYRPVQRVGRSIRLYDIR